jgi:carboxymethylenebutenolidase
MSVSDDSQLPIDSPGPGTATLTELTLTSGDGTSLAATLAQPSDPSGAGVLVLPDNRGLRAFYEQLAQRLAEHGHVALVIDWFGRTDGVGKDRPEEWPVVEHLAQLTREGLEADIAAGVAELRSALGGGDRSIVAVGFCFGGRQAFFSTQPKSGCCASWPIARWGASADRSRARPRSGPAGRPAPDSRCRSRPTSAGTSTSA